MAVSRFVVPLLLLGSASVAPADDGWWSTAGGIGCYGKSHPSIRMVSEDLKIRIRSRDTARVDVLFTFRNEGEATSVTMAFPENYEIRVGRSLRHFRTWVDGEHVHAWRQVVMAGDPHSPAGGDELCEAVWLKRVHFKANQTHLVRVSYIGLTSGGTDGNRSFSYTLTTGATWKGPIGKCKITVSWPSELTSLSPARTNLSAPELNLPPAKWRLLPGRRAVTTLTNWKPKDDLDMDMHPGFGNLWINGKRVTSKGMAEESIYPLKPLTIGRTSNPLIRTDLIRNLLKKNAPKDSITSRMSSYSEGTISLDSGERRRLRHKPKAVRFEAPYANPEEGKYVYLRDLVEASGGKFRYDASYGRVELTL